MRRTAQIARNAFLAVVLITLAASVGFSKTAWAASGNVQVCQPNTSCQVGEFLYDDSYVPITSASCTITSRYPDGSLFLNAASMTASSQNDGWYYKDFTTPATSGLYRTQVCCTSGTDYLCLDKTFEAKEEATTSNVANAVWNASKSSYTTSGTFGAALQNIVPSASDIAYATWSYSSRSLSTFGNLASDVWGIGTRTLTGVGLSSGSLATKSDVDAISVTNTSTTTNVQNVTNEVNNISNTVNETRNLLEQVVNKPIIETTTSDDVVPDFGAKIKESERKAKQFSVDTQSLDSKIDLMVVQWNKVDQNALLDIVEKLNKKIGGENDKASSPSLFGSLRYFQDSWDWESVKLAQNQTKRLRDISVALQKDLEAVTPSKTAFAKAKALAVLLDELESIVGSVSSTADEQSIFGKLKETKVLASSLDASAKDVRAVLSKWDVYKMTDKQQKMNRLSKKVVVINKIPSVRKTLLSISPKTDKALKNKGYFVLGIIDSNKKLLARKTGTPLINTWLELGSIVFKSLVSNPSTLISQEVSLKYYLPEEIKKENIIDLDPELKATYDTEKKQYYVSGKFLLAPSETKTVEVRTSDIWTIEQSEIDTMRKQAGELARPLENTSYFAQGVTIKSDIDVSLDKAIALTKSATTPEEKIRAYREAEIEIDAAKEKIAKLKELAAQAGSVGTLFGFVGGVQALAVWGLILILVAGFVFLALYMKLLMRQEKALQQPQKARPSVAKPASRHGHIIKGLTVLVFFGVGVGVAGGFMLGRSSLATADTKAFASTPQKPAVLGTMMKKSEATSAAILKKIDTVTVADTPTGFLRVREKPWGTEITQVHPGDTFTLTEEKDGWFHIQLADGSGWISAQYAVKSDL